MTPFTRFLLIFGLVVLVVLVCGGPFSPLSLLGTGFGVVFSTIAAVFGAAFGLLFGALALVPLLIPVLILATPLLLAVGLVAVVARAATR